MRVKLILLTIAVFALPPFALVAEEEGNDEPMTEEAVEVDEVEPESMENAAAAPMVFEVQVHGLPPAGRAWAETRPVQELPGVHLLNIKLDQSRLVLRVSGELDRDALEEAVAASGLRLVYITQRE